MADSTDSSWSRKAKDTTAGFVGGAVQVLIGQPFDLVKVRLQTGQFSTPLQAFSKTLAAEGPLAFYKGTATPLIGVGVCVSVQFYAFHEARRFILNRNNNNGDGSNQLSLGQFYLAGALAGIANSPVAGPVEQIRILLQTQRYNHKVYDGPLDAVKKIYRSEGLPGIFRGQGVTLLREAQAYGLWFLTFEFLMKQLQTRSGVKRNDIPAYQVAACGALAGEVLWLGSYPLDVIKSQVQSDGFGKDKVYHGAIDAAKKTFRTAGLAGFWKGLVPTLLRATPCSAGTFASVELTMRLLG
ncbi:mitochondrial carrier domain-containing protein [Lipomyces japonicus]|uniref:mitochondrial carrier domain-containing protein n=1 Tax=Lipomyces japonicus TaxID=56871 RepID=UPI0034CD083E